jgi:hypothetical protein
VTTATPTGVEPVRQHPTAAREDLLRVALAVLAAERAPGGPDAAADSEYAEGRLLDAVRAVFLAGLPEIVVLCGSTRFYPYWVQENFRLTCEGKIVLSVGFYPNAQEEAHGETIGTDPDLKERLDELHLRKIDLADRVLVINPGGYIGESTAREIHYATRAGKPVEYLADRITHAAGAGAAR